MEQSRSSEANIHSANREITHRLWNPNVHYRVYKNPPLVHILIHMNTVHTLPPYFPKIQPKFCMHFSSLPCVESLHTIHKKYGEGRFSCDIDWTH
jgi:hypothetical protein